MLIRLSELRELIGEVLTEAEKKGGEKKGKWVPPWLLQKGKDEKAKKNEAAGDDERKEEKPAEKKAPPVAAKKEKGAASGKAMPVGHELNKGKGKASGGDAAGKKAKPAAFSDKPVAKKKEAPASVPSKKGPGGGSGKPFVSPDKDVMPKNKGKVPIRAEFGVDDEEDLSGEDLSVGVGDVSELEAPQSLEDVPTNVVGLRVWLRDFVAPRIPESQIGAFHRLITAFVSQAEERQLAAKEPEMTKRLGLAPGAKQAKKPASLGQPPAKKGVAANLAEKKK